MTQDRERNFKGKSENEKAMQISRQHKTERKGHDRRAVCTGVRVAVEDAIDEQLCAHRFKDIDDGLHSLGGAAFVLIHAAVQRHI